jgi:hypothetical protein
MDFCCRNDLIGKRLLVGVTYLNRGGELLGQEEFHGRIVKASQCAIVLERADTGVRVSLPPGVESAAPGEYRLLVQRRGCG